MSTPERQGMIQRVKQLRNARAATPPSQVAGPSSDSARIKSLEDRLAYLEDLVQGLQDSVYREAQRQDTRLDELEKQVEPAALAVALSKDARDRGL
jgi:hypothetical protein